MAWLIFWALSEEIFGDLPATVLAKATEKATLAITETKTVIMHMKFDDSFSPEGIDTAVLPDFPEDYKLYFSGIIPDWFIGSLSYSYDNKEKALFKPDAEGGTLITYASSDIGKIGLKESNPPGIDLAEFFSKIPNSPCTFVTRPTAEDSTQNTEEPEQDY